MNSINKSLIVFVIILNNFTAYSSKKDLIIATSFFKNIIKSKFENAYNLIDSKYQIKYTPQSINIQWKTMSFIYGNYKKRDSVWLETSINKTTVFQRLKFEKGWVILKINIKNEKISGFYLFPIEKKYKYMLPAYNINNYNEYVINIPSEQNIFLPAILTIPKNKSKNKLPPIVILVHGSGPANKDEEIGPNKPFKDIAIGLASKGIASLRYEKRTLEYEDDLSLKTNDITLYEETITDAVLASKFMTNNPLVDSNNIFILGHSLGAMCAPKIAELNNKINGLILLAPPFRPLDSIILSQIEYISKIDSTNLQLNMLANTIKHQINILNSDSFSLETKNIFLPMNLSAKYWLSVKNYDQKKTLLNLRKNSLILQGERDYQVTIKDFNMWQTYIKNNNTTFISYPKLNHLFFEGSGICTPLEYEKQANIVSYVIEDIANWIFNHIQ